MKSKNKKFNKNIFRNGSKTYYTSSLFFSKKINHEVLILYSFLRTADDYVDLIPQQKDEFFKFKSQILDSIEGKIVDNQIAMDFAELFHRKKFEKEWVISFFEAMESDLGKVNMKTLKETEKYMYGSAEVVGLFMAKILDLEKDSYKYAKLLGKSMQYINFIRDFKEDLSLGRTYLPLDEAKKFNLDNLKISTVEKNKEYFEMFIKKQIDHFFLWDRQAREGFKFIDKKNLIPIKTAQDSYLWTAKKIYNDPLIILRKKIKPSKLRIIMFAFKNKF
jgi:15-cis-phytoene synthase